MSEDTPTTMPPPAPPATSDRDRLIDETVIKTNRDESYDEGHDDGEHRGFLKGAFVWGGAVFLLFALFLWIIPAARDIWTTYHDSQAAAEQLQNEENCQDQGLVYDENEDYWDGDFSDGCVSGPDYANSAEIDSLRERVQSLENCGQMETYDPSVNGCRSNLDPNVVFPTMQDLLGGMTQLPETDYHGGPDLCLPEETYIPDLDVCQTQDGTYLAPIPDMNNVPTTTIPPTPPTTTMPPQGVWDCAFDETWDVALQDCVPVTTTTWPEPPPTYEPPATLPSIGMDECLENGNEWYDPDTQDNIPGECYFN